MSINWAAKVEAAIAELEIKSNRVLEPAQALAIIDDVVDGKLTVTELAVVHGIPPQWIGTTLGYITRAVGTGPVRSLAKGGWYEFKSTDRPYGVASGFSAAWKKARACYD